MASPHSPIGSRRRLGAELRRLRSLAGLTLEDVAEQMTCSTSKISRLETGKGIPKVPDVRELMRIYGVRNGAEEEELLRLVHDGREHGWWEPLADGVRTERYVLDEPGRFAALENDATAVRLFAMSIVPGLLQTRAYGRAVSAAFLPHHSATEVDRLVELRIKRQEALYKTVDPLRLIALIDESVLRRAVAGPVVMADQLARIDEIAELPNVDVHVLPFSAGLLRVHSGDFVILEIPAELGSDIVHIESHAGNTSLDSRPDIERYEGIHSDGLAAALRPEESRAMLAGYLAEFRSAGR